MIGKLLCRIGLHKMQISGDWYVCRRCGFRKLTETGVEDLHTNISEIHYRSWLADDAKESREYQKRAEIREKKILDGARLRARALLAARSKPEITADNYDAAMIRIDNLSFGRGIEITDEEMEELDGLVDAVMRYEAKLAGETAKEV